MPEDPFQERFSENVSLLLFPPSGDALDPGFFFDWEKTAGGACASGLRIQGRSTINCMKDGIFGNQRVMSRMMEGKA
jgi:hypothetical protein